MRSARRSDRGRPACRARAAQRRPPGHEASARMRMFRGSRAGSDRPSPARGRQRRGSGARRRRCAAGARDPRARRRAMRCAIPRVGPRPHCPCHPRLASSRESHARAVFQSLFTVRTETPNASAVSATTESSEEPQLDDPTGARRHVPRERSRHRQSPPRRRRALAPAGSMLVERHRRDIGAAFGGLARPRRVHQHASHDRRRRREEVRPILPLDRLLPSDEPQVGFVYEVGGPASRSRAARRQGPAARGREAPPEEAAPTDRARRCPRGSMPATGRSADLPAPGPQSRPESIRAALSPGFRPHLFKRNPWLICATRRARRRSTGRHEESVACTRIARRSWRLASALRRRLDRDAAIDRSRFVVGPCRVGALGRRCGLPAHPPELLDARQRPLRAFA